VWCFFKYDGDFKETIHSESVYHGINKKLVAAHNLPGCSDALHAACAELEAAASTVTAGNEACGRARATSHARAAVMMGGAVDAAAEAEASAIMSMFGF
jgi:hypothetical protein